MNHYDYYAMKLDAIVNASKEVAFSESYKNFTDFLNEYKDPLKKIDEKSVLPFLHIFLTQIEEFIPQHEFDEIIKDADLKLLHESSLYDVINVLSLSDGVISNGKHYRLKIHTIDQKNSDNSLMLYYDKSLEKIAEKILIEVDVENKTALYNAVINGNITMTQYKIGDKLYKIEILMIPSSFDDDFIEKYVC